MEGGAVFSEDYSAQSLKREGSLHCSLEFQRSSLASLIRTVNPIHARDGIKTPSWSYLLHGIRPAMSSAGNLEYPPWNSNPRGELTIFTIFTILLLFLVPMVSRLSVLCFGNSLDQVRTPPPKRPLQIPQVQRCAEKSIAPSHAPFPSKCCDAQMSAPLSKARLSSPVAVSP